MGMEEGKRDEQERYTREGKGRRVMVQYNLIGVDRSATFWADYTTCSKYLS